jgi:DNA primase
MPIPEHVLQEIRERTDLVELVSESVPLRKRGRNFVGLCPFHREKTPSFNVNPELQIFKCFGCGVGGNAITYLMSREGLSFPDAARRLAARAGVAVPEAAEPGERSRWQPLLEANAFAAELYARTLADAPEAGAARAYLDGREVGTAARDTFRLGWAPAAWDTLLEAARASGLAESALLEAGLLSRSERTGGVFDRFRARIVFPVSDAAGRVVGFSGRRLEEGEDAPKYLNTAETPLFRKGELLFGLGLTKNAIRQRGEAVVVEGNFDLVSLHERGVPNVVAPLGTALTESQARLLGRYAPRVVLLYDGDEAGLKAAFRSGDELLARGLEVRIAFLPAGRDPDAFVRAEGPAALRALLRDAPDPIEAKLRVLRERLDLSGVPARRRAVEVLLRSIRRIPDAITRELQVRHVADALGVGVDVLTRDAAPPRVARPAAGRRTASAGGADGAGRTRPAAAKPAKIPAAERYLLLVLLRSPGYLPRARELVVPEDFRSPAARRLYELLLDRDAAGDAGAVLDRADAETQALVADLLLTEESLEAAEAIFSDSALRIRESALDRDLAERTRRGDDLEEIWRVARERLRLRGGAAGGPPSAATED